MLDPVEERILLEKAQKGDQWAVRKIVEYHQLLANKIARQYTDKRIWRNGEPDPDLVSAAIEGTLIAIPRFDLNQPVRFATYAQFWMRSLVATHAYDNQHIVVIASNVRLRMRRTRHAVEELQKANPAWSLERIVRQVAEDLGVTIEHVHLSLLAYRTTSMDVPISDRAETPVTGKEISFRDELRDPGLSPEESLLGREVTTLLTSLVQRLPERERTIIEYRYLNYDLGTPTTKRNRNGRRVEIGTTLEVLAAKWGLSRERVRQLERLALAKLKRMLSAYRVRKTGDMF